jgi:ATP-binding cassette subfamily B protein
MISRVAHDSEALHGLMHQITGGFLLQIVQLIGVGAMLVWINPKLALFTLIPVPLVILGSWIFWRHVYPRHYRLWDASSKQMAALSGMLSGIRVVKAFSQESRERDRFHAASDHLRHWRQWVEHTNTTYAASMQIVFGLGGLIVWYVGGRDVIGGQMTLGQLIAFLAYLAMFYAPLGALSNFTTWLTSFLSGSQRVLELLDTPALIAEPKQPVAWENVRGEIRFQDVTLSLKEFLKRGAFSMVAGELVWQTTSLVVQQIANLKFFGLRETAFQDFARMTVVIMLCRELFCLSCNQL